MLSALIAYLLYALPVKEQAIGVYLGLAPLLLLFIAGYAQAGLYPGFGVGPVETLRRLSYVTAFGYLVLAGFAFALKLPPLYYSRVTFALALAFSVVALPLGRAMVWRAASAHGWWREPVVVVGTGARALRAIRSIQSVDHLGYRPVAVLAPRPHTAGVAI